MGGEGGGVPTPLSEINDIHTFNYTYSMKSHLIVSSLASEAQIAPEALSWPNTSALQHACPQTQYNNILYPPFIDSWICMHAPVRTHD